MMNLRSWMLGRQPLTPQPGGVLVLSVLVLIGGNLYSSQTHLSSALNFLATCGGSRFSDAAEVGWLQYGKVSLTAHVESSRFLGKGWSLREGCNLPTFTTSRPRSSPGCRAAGLD